MEFVRQILGDSTCACCAPVETTPEPTPGTVKRKRAFQSFIPIIPSHDSTGSLGSEGTNPEDDARVAPRRNGSPTAARFDAPPARAQVGAFQRKSGGGGGPGERAGHGRSRARRRMAERQRRRRVFLAGVLDVRRCPPRVGTL